MVIKLKEENNMEKLKKVKVGYLIIALAVSVFVGIEAYKYFKPEPIEEEDDIDDIEVDPSLLADED